MNGSRDSTDGLPFKKCALPPQKKKKKKKKEKGVEEIHPCMYELHFTVQYLWMMLCMDDIMDGNYAAKQRLIWASIYKSTRLIYIYFPRVYQSLLFHG